jgi:nudix motif 8
MRWRFKELDIVRKRLKRLQLPRQDTIPNPGGKRKTAAVLVGLCNIDSTASMLFTVRTNKVRTHRGQVSFPGGHIDVGETPVEAAVRELQEEVGDHLEVEVLGIGAEVLAVTGTIVTPVVGFVKNIKTSSEVALLHTTASVTEVDQIFTCTLKELLDDTNKGYEDLHRGPLMPYWTCGPQRIWGLTAYIADQMLGKVFPFPE